MSDECELGKLEYWDAAYKQEYENFTDFGDEGEIWFGEDVLETLISWLNQCIQSRFGTDRDIQILDIGCGNGHLLFELHQLGYQNLTGTDYSQQSILLANEIFQSKGISSIQFLVDNVLNSKLHKKFDVVVDKGTFDAITLGDQPRNEYPRSICQLLKPCGILVLTSCNFTKKELIEEFKGQLEWIDNVTDYKSFSFAGEEGTRVSTVAFKITSSNTFQSL
eukprot:g201.t1